MVLFCKQDTQQHFSQRQYIGFIQACLLTRGKHHSLKFNYLYWLWADKKLKQCAAVLTYIPRTNTNHSQHTQILLCSMRFFFYSPGTTDLWTWDLTVLWRHPSFFSVLIPVALPKSPKQKGHKYTNTLEIHKKAEVKLSKEKTSAPKVTAHSWKKKKKKQYKK